MTSYKLLLLTPDGENSITEGDGKGWSIEDCSRESANMGSKWIFHPYHFIIIDKGENRVFNSQLIIKAGEGLERFERRRVGYVRKTFKEFSNLIIKG